MSAVSLVERVGHSAALSAGMTAESSAVMD